MMMSGKDFMHEKPRFELAAKGVFRVTGKMLHLLAGRA